MISEKDKKIITCLRKNARQTLASISRQAKIPLSTVYDRIKLNEKGLILKYTSLVDFSRLGFNLRMQLLANAKDRTKLIEFINGHGLVNNAFRISGEYEFLLDCIFPSMKELTEFTDQIKSHCSGLKVFHVVEELKREAFFNG